MAHVLVVLGTPTNASKPRVVCGEMGAENGDLLERRVLGDQTDRRAIYAMGGKGCVSIGSIGSLPL